MTNRRNRTSSKYLGRLTLIDLDRAANPQPRTAGATTIAVYVPCFICQYRGLDTPAVHSDAQGRDLCDECYWSGIILRSMASDHEYGNWPTCQDCTQAGPRTATAVGWDNNIRCDHHHLAYLHGSH